MGCPMKGPVSSNSLFYYYYESYNLCSQIIQFSRFDAVKRREAICVWMQGNPVETLFYVLVEIEVPVESVNPLLLEEEHEEISWVSWSNLQSVEESQAPCVSRSMKNDCHMQRTHVPVMKQRRYMNKCSCYPNCV